MKNYYFDKNAELTPELICSILNDYQTRVWPTLNRRFNYYIGKQKIMSKQSSDAGKPCNKIVCNFVRNIAETYEGYALGIPVTYESDSEGFEELLNILNYNDIQDEDAEFFRKALIFGRSAEICYIDEDGKTRFKSVDPREVIPIYDNTLNGEMIYALRVWKEDLSDNKSERFYVDVYDNVNVTSYRSNQGFSSLSFIKQEPHHFSQVPVSIFSLNDEEEGVADSIFSLQDAYNSLISDSIDDWDSFCDAYLVLKGAIADDEDLERMKEHRVLMLDNEADASYLVKNTSTTEIENLLTTVEAKIRELTACPNFANEEFGTSSGIAIRYRCMAMENRVAAMLSNFKKAIQRRIELLSDIVALLNGEELWRDIEITFTRNLPVNENETIDMINKLQGLVSKRTLLSQIAFVTDIDAEMERLKEEREQYSLFDYNTLPVSREVEDNE